MRTLPLLLLAACSLEPFKGYSETGQEIDQLLRLSHAPAPMLLEPASGDASVVTNEQIASDVEIVKADTSCYLRKPWLKPTITHSHACIAGQEFLAIYSRGFTHAPGPKRPAWLLFSTRAATQFVDLSSLGYDDCWLMLDRPTALEPDGVHLVNDSNRLTLRWTPSHALVGATFYTQAVWIEPGANDRHALFSDMLRLRVGNHVATPPRDWAAWWSDR